MIWREYRVLLIVLAVLLAANAVFFFTYRVQYESRLQALDTRLQQTEEQLQRARNKRLSAEQQLASYNKAQIDLQNLYNYRWSTKAQRLTALINELKRMGAVTQLDPNSMNFSQAQDREAQKSGGVGAFKIVRFKIQATQMATVMPSRYIAIIMSAPIERNPKSFRPEKKAAIINV